MISEPAEPLSQAAITVPFSCCLRLWPFLPGRKILPEGFPSQLTKGPFGPKLWKLFDASSVPHSRVNTVHQKQGDSTRVLVALGHQPEQMPPFSSVCKLIVHLAVQTATRTLYAL